MCKIYAAVILIYPSFILIVFLYSIKISLNSLRRKRSFHVRHPQPRQQCKHVWGIYIVWELRFPISNSQASRIDSKYTYLSNREGMGNAWNLSWNVMQTETSPLFIHNTSPSSEASNTEYHNRDWNMILQLLNTLCIMCCQIMQYYALPPGSSSQIAPGWVGCRTDKHKTWE